MFLLSLLVELILCARSVVILVVVEILIAVSVVVVVNIAQKQIF